MDNKFPSFWVRSFYVPRLLLSSVKPFDRSNTEMKVESKNGSKTRSIPQIETAR